MKKFNKNNVKVGDKVTLLKYSECEQQPWYSTDKYDGEDEHGTSEFSAKYGEKDHESESILKEMFQYLGCIDLTVSEVTDRGFYIKEDPEEWNWPYQLIKNIKK